MIRKTIIGLLAGALALLGFAAVAQAQESGYRLAIHPVTGECVYLNLNGTLDEPLYTAEQAAAAEACNPTVVSAPEDEPTSPAVSAAAPGADGYVISSSTVVRVDVVTSEEQASYEAEASAYRRAIANAEATIAELERQLAAAILARDAAPPAWRTFLQRTVNAIRGQLPPARANLEGLRAASAPRAPETVETEIENTYMALDSDGDGVLEHHNCNGRLISGRLIPAGYADDGVTPLPFADALRAACGL